MTKALSATISATSLASEQAAGTPGATQPLAADVSLFEQMLSDQNDHNQSAFCCDANENAGNTEKEPLHTFDSDEVDPPVSRQRFETTNNSDIDPKSREQPSTKFTQKQEQSVTRTLSPETKRFESHYVKDNRTAEPHDANATPGVKQAVGESHRPVQYTGDVAKSIAEDRGKSPLGNADSASAPNVPTTTSGQNFEPPTVFRTFPTTDKSTVVAPHPVLDANPESGQNVQAAVPKKLVEGPLVDGPSTPETPGADNQSIEHKTVTRSKTDNDLTNGQSEHHSDSEAFAPVSLGDEVLRGLQDSVRQSDKTLAPSTSEKLITYIEQVVDRIAIVETSSSEFGDIHIALKDSVLPDTEVVVSRQQAMIVVNFLTGSDESAHLLESNQRLLESQLSGALDKPVSVSVDVSADQQDGRSRGQRDLYTEMQEADS
ncbi:type III secretion HpaP family protein [Thalassoglobus sp. JC818]|uniref:type III secretion HpaP family protein n=1 Tax=Thalassoglobus sp. JC818 TaxID=3232136 RepID=UPI0034573D52